MHTHPTTLQQLEQSDAVVAFRPRGAADATNLSPREIAKAIETGELRSFKRGRRRIILKEDLMWYLRSNA